MLSFARIASIAIASCCCSATVMDQLSNKLTPDSISDIFSFLSTTDKTSFRLARPLRPASLNFLRQEVLSYSSKADRVALVLALEPRLALMLRESIGVATDIEAVEDFVQYNGPELDAALADVQGDQMLVDAVSKVALSYLDCLSRPFCKYMPAYFRDPARFAEVFIPGPRYTVTFGPSEDIENEFVTIRGDFNHLRTSQPIISNYLQISPFGRFLVDYSHGSDLSRGHPRFIDPETGYSIDGRFGTTWIPEMRALRVLDRLTFMGKVFRSQLFLPDSTEPIPNANFGYFASPALGFELFEHGTEVFTWMRMIDGTVVRGSSGRLHNWSRQQSMRYRSEEMRRIPIAEDGHIVGVHLGYEISPTYPDSLVDWINYIKSLPQPVWDEELHPRQELLAKIFEAVAEGRNRQAVKLITEFIDQSPINYATGRLDNTELRHLIKDTITGTPQALADLKLQIEERFRA